MLYRDNIHTGKVGYQLSTRKQAPDARAHIYKLLSLVTHRIIEKELSHLLKGRGPLNFCALDMLSSRLLALILAIIDIFKTLHPLYLRNI